LGRAPSLTALPSGTRSDSSKWSTQHTTRESQNFLMSLSARPDRWNQRQRASPERRSCASDSASTAAFASGILATRTIVLRKFFRSRSVISTVPAAAHSFMDAPSGGGHSTMGTSPWRQVHGPYMHTRPMAGRVVTAEYQFFLIKHRPQDVDRKIISKARKTKPFQYVMHR